MFARKAFFRLKSISVSAEFKCAFDNEVIPLMRAQNGFVGELMLANPGSLERITTSLWESQADAEAYRTHVYPQVLKILSKTIDGTPKIHTFDEVTFSVDTAAASHPTAATAAPNERAGSSLRSTLSTPSTSACSSSSPA